MSSRGSSSYGVYKPISLNGGLLGVSSSFGFGHSLNYASSLANHRAKENICVTIRFRPLSYKEIQGGDEVAWYADGDTTVCSEYNPLAAYTFDRVFGPATTTREVYDTAARHAVQGAMDGLNCTVFAYGVTSSGKTHTMHGDQKSPGIIPLAIRDVFRIIQETPGREFLLRVSYLEIYNEVINDLLDPAGKNLRIREDYQGAYVEGMKEEVVTSPVHALSLIAAGEAHRHVGSNNFNLLSSRSHTIFTLTIESTSQGADYDNDEVTLSQLNLIDLAGSESSKTETTGLRRKEGSYINKSLLTLGTVIAKLGEGRASHIPYRDSKLSRLLQSSLSGHGRISLICTVTPASSSAEETHNTLKFAQRAKRVETHATPNRIMDDKSLIKKYQKEVAYLRRELDQLRRSISDQTVFGGCTQEDLITLRRQLEAGQMKMQSRIQEEEQAKAALMGRIQRLTKLILVSTVNSIQMSVPERLAHGRRHSFGDELSLLERRRSLGLSEDEDVDSFAEEGQGDVNGSDDASKKKIKRGMLSWLKLKRNENLFGSATSLESTSSPTVSTTSVSSTGAQFLDSVHLLKGGRRGSFNRKGEEFVIDSVPECTQAGELFSATIQGCRPPPSGETMADQMDLLREQAKMVAAEVALLTSSLKRLSEQGAANPDDSQLQDQIQKTNDEIEEKQQQSRLLEQRIISVGEAALNNASPLQMSQTISKLIGQLNENEFDLEIKSADNRILQEQLKEKIAENNKLQETIASLKEKLASSNGKFSGELDGSDNEISTSKGGAKVFAVDLGLQSRLLMQAAEIEILKQEKVHLEEEKEGLLIQCEKLAEESCYAKELASAAAVELKHLAEEVTKLSFQNTKLTRDLAKTQALVLNPISGNEYSKYAKRDNLHAKGGNLRNSIDIEKELGHDIDSWQLDPEDVRKELHARKEKEAFLEASLAEKEEVQAELKEKLEEAKQREVDLENDLAGMWVLVAQLKKERDMASEFLSTESNKAPQAESNSHSNIDEKYGMKNEIQSNGMPENTKECNKKAVKHLETSLEEEEHYKTKELESFVSHLKDKDNQGSGSSVDYRDDKQISHICKVCIKAQTAAVLLPCRHLCLCEPCAVACTECPLCRSSIADIIIPFKS